ncbi:V-SNARE_N-terminal domain-containing protein [Hexamita inflata]|uniref:V-SNARE N-terminal domain-containing protein n=1 Tax=Hexamita inflata TaxID=28002 RepID=A0AA86UTA3_9EUKA|nr:V-SNARE N-terminal domain-containing protein [Hexamita inflata]CAI9970780.1 V-SNARE N-terminal domain-containing protein [Hexamita inflata]
MQPIQKPNQQLSHTSRFRPSKELIQITKRKMDEANDIMKKLEARLQKTTSTSERKAVEEKLADLKKQYASYIEDLQSVEAAQAEPLPRVKEPAKIDPQTVLEEIKKEQQELSASSYQPNSSQNIPKAAMMGESILKRRAEKTCQSACNSTKWSEVQKQHVEECARQEKEENDQRAAAQQKYRSELAWQCEPEIYAKSHKMDMMKTRVKSPKMYQDSTFAHIGAQDELIKQNAKKNQEKLRDETEKHIAEQNKHKEEAKRLDRSIPDISNGILPADKLDASGKVIKQAIPEKYIKGTYSNQEKPTQKPTLIQIHDSKKVAELATNAEEDRLTKLREDRDKATKQKQLETVSMYQKQSAMVVDSTKAYKNDISKDKYGSLRYVDDDQVAHGNFYQTTNRRVNKQPDAKQDVVYGEGNFITRMDQADRRRAQNHEQNVLPLTESEKEAIEAKRRATKMPQSVPLDETDVKIIKNYIDDAYEEGKRQEKLLAEQKKYNQTLSDFMKQKAAQNEDDMNEQERAMMVAPRMVKAPF